MAYRPLVRDGSGVGRSRGRRAGGRGSGGQLPSPAAAADLGLLHRLQAPFTISLARACRTLPLSVAMTGAAVTLRARRRRSSTIGAPQALKAAAALAAAALAAAGSTRCHKGNRGKKRSITRAPLRSRRRNCWLPGCPLAGGDITQEFHFSTTVYDLSIGPRSRFACK